MESRVPDASSNASTKSKDMTMKEITNIVRCARKQERRLRRRVRQRARRGLKRRRRERQREAKKLGPKDALGRQQVDAAGAFAHSTTVTSGHADADTVGSASNAADAETVDPTNDAVGNAVDTAVMEATNTQTKWSAIAGIALFMCVATIGMAVCSASAVQRGVAHAARAADAAGDRVFRHTELKFENFEALDRADSSGLAQSSTKIRHYFFTERPIGRTPAGSRRRAQRNDNPSRTSTRIAHAWANSGGLSDEPRTTTKIENLQARGIGETDGKTDANANAVAPANTGLAIAIDPCETTDASLAMGAAAYE